MMIGIRFKQPCDPEHCLLVERLALYMQPDGKLSAIYTRESGGNGYRAMAGNVRDRGVDITQVHRECILLFADGERR